MDTLIKSGITLVSLVVAAIPLWIWLAAHNMLEPNGFWQEIVVLGLGVWILGGLQIIFVFFLLVWLVALWGD